MAQDKELALGVGVSAMTRDDIRKINNDKGVLLGCALDGTFKHSSDCIHFRRLQAHPES